MRRPAATRIETLQQVKQYYFHFGLYPHIDVLTEHLSVSRMTLFIWFKNLDSLRVETLQNAQSDLMSSLHRLAEAEREKLGKQGEQKKPSKRAAKAKKAAKTSEAAKTKTPDAKLSRILYSEYCRLLTEPGRLCGVTLLPLGVHLDPQDPLGILCRHFLEQQVSFLAACLEWDGASDVNLRSRQLVSVALGNLVMRGEVSEWQMRLNTATLFDFVVKSRKRSIRLTAPGDKIDKADRADALPVKRRPATQHSLKVDAQLKKNQQAARRAERGNAAPEVRSVRRKRPYEWIKKARLGQSKVSQSKVSQSKVRAKG